MRVCRRIRRPSFPACDRPSLLGRVRLLLAGKCARVVPLGPAGSLHHRRNLVGCGRIPGSQAAPLVWRLREIRCVCRHPQANHALSRYGRQSAAFRCVSYSFGATISRPCGPNITRLHSQPEVSKHIFPEVSNHNIFGFILPPLKCF